MFTQFLHPYRNNLDLTLNKNKYNKYSTTYNKSKNLITKTQSLPQSF